MCWFIRLFFSFLFVVKDAFTVILHSSLSCAWVIFLEAVGTQRDWFQASLEFTAVLTLLTTITEEDKHFS